MGIKKIALGGGPCAGKTEDLKAIEENFRESSVKVFTISETATELILSGVTPDSFGVYEFQKKLLLLQIKKEKILEEKARLMDFSKILIVCDRGVLDGKAYAGEEAFDRILEETGLLEKSLQNRYDAVFHLVTAAKGAERAYSLSNNKARRESLEEAEDIDDKLIAVWESCENFSIIDNSTDFDGKMEKLIKAVKELAD